MATSPLPSSPSPAAGNASAPPNFYAQAATAQPSPTPAKPHAEDTAKFRAAIPKLLVIFDKLEKLKPNGQDISKEIKAMAQTLKDTRIKVFSGEDEEEEQPEPTETQNPTPPMNTPGGTGAA